MSGLIRVPLYGTGKPEKQKHQPRGQMLSSPDMQVFNSYLLAECVEYARHRKPRMATGNQHFEGSWNCKQIQLWGSKTRAMQMHSQKECHSHSQGPRCSPWNVLSLWRLLNSFCQIASSPSSSLSKAQGTGQWQRTEGCACWSTQCISNSSPHYERPCREVLS